MFKSEVVGNFEASIFLLFEGIKEYFVSIPVAIQVLPAGLVLQPKALDFQKLLYTGKEIFRRELMTEEDLQKNTARRIPLRKNDFLSRWQTTALSRSES